MNFHQPKLDIIAPGEHVWSSALEGAQYWGDAFVDALAGALDKVVKLGGSGIAAVMPAVGLSAGAVALGGSYSHSPSSIPKTSTSKTEAQQFAIALGREPGLSGVSLPEHKASSHEVDMNDLGTMPLVFTPPTSISLAQARGECLSRA